MKDKSGELRVESGEWGCGKRPGTAPGAAGRGRCPPRPFGTGAAGANIHPASWDRHRRRSQRPSRTPGTDTAVGADAHIGPWTPAP